MKIRSLLSALTLLVATARGATPEPFAPMPPSALVVCGWDILYIVDVDRPAPDGTPTTLWSWKAAGRKDLPAEYQPLFATMDECKPVGDGSRILVTSSGGTSHTGGVALIDWKQDRVVFHGRATNAHSADLLPGDRIAVAASESKSGTGDALILFDATQSGKELWRGELAFGHGVVWDEQRQILWALGQQEVRAYRLADWNTTTPKLTLEAVIRLPEDGGHELSPVPGSSDLVISTNTKCWLFERDTRTVRPHPAFGSQPRMKCVSQDPRTGRIAYVMAPTEHWWSLKLYFQNPQSECPAPGGKAYKVRWLGP